MKNLFKALILLAILASCEEENVPKPLPESLNKTVNFDVEYKITIVNDHEVQFTTAHDTVVILLENAYALSGQNPVAYIRK